MLIKAIEVGYLQTNCYIVADEATLDAAVIDPGADSNLILDYLERCHFHVDEHGVIPCARHSAHARPFRSLHGAGGGL